MDKVDAAMMDQLKDLLEDRFGELIERFISDGAKRILLIKQALPSLNFVVIYAEAHGLKGSSRNIGANPLGDACDLLEEKGRKKNGEDIEALFAEVEQEFAAVCDVLSTY
jgi:HPt (histidine-containing phosphotransfer) domain-containing protein